MRDSCARRRSSALRECQGCSIAKGRGKSIPTTTGSRAAKPGNRAFLYVSGKKSVQFAGGKRTCSYSEMTLLGPTLSMSCTAKMRFPNTAVGISRTTVLLVCHFPQKLYARTVLQNVRVECLLIFAGNGLSDKNLPLKTVHNVMAKQSAV